MRPKLPARTQATASRMPWLERDWVPVWTMRSYLAAASTILRPSQMLWETGFST